VQVLLDRRFGLFCDPYKTFVELGSWMRGSSPRMTLDGERVQLIHATVARDLYEIGQMTTVKEIEKAIASFRAKGWLNSALGLMSSKLKISTLQPNKISPRANSTGLPSRPLPSTKMGQIRAAIPCAICAT
jgi:hypothetical protein